MLSRCFLDCSVGEEVFVTGLSQISSFFSCSVIQSNLSYVTLQGRKEIRSHKTGGR